MLKKYWAIILTVLFLAAAIIILLFFVERKPIPIPNPEPIQPPTTTSTDGPLPSTWKTYTTSSFQVRYPTETFASQATSSGILLLSDVFVIENPSGIPGKEMEHRFSIQFEVRSGDLKATQKAVIGQAASLVEPYLIAGKNGEHVLMGVEGVNVDYIFLPTKQPDQTLVITFKYIGDFLNPKLPEKEQKKIFEDVIGTLEM